MSIIPGVYKDLAPKNRPDSPQGYDICMVHGVATHEANDDKRVIIERTHRNGSGPSIFQHLTISEFQEEIHVNDRKTARFVFIHANSYQD